MTEEEAKKKWCPLTRSIHMISRSRSGDTFADFKENCIASDCMMWVWYSDVCSPEAKEANKGKGNCGLRR